MSGWCIPLTAPDDATSFRGDDRRLYALRNQLGLIFRDGRENMDREAIGLREIGGDE